MDATILTECDLEEYTKNELLDLYDVLIKECRNRNLKDTNGRYI
jgi:hypothetical protein